MEALGGLVSFAVHWALNSVSRGEREVFVHSIQKSSENQFKCYLNSRIEFSIPCSE